MISNIASAAQPPSNVVVTSESWWADPKQWRGKGGWQEIVEQMRNDPRGIPPELMRLVRTPEAEKITGYKSSQRHLKIQRGQHPAPVPLSDDGRAVGYLLLELIAHNLSLLAAQLDAKPRSRPCSGAVK